MSRIENLLTAMTLEEKIGQLNMITANYAVTGPIVAGDSTEGIRAGHIGNMLNLWGAEPARRAQRLAVEESRLGIPLLLGFDTVHGQRTIFPIGPAEAGIFDERVWESTARMAAVEAARDGLSMAFAPMIDVARDPRWGRMAEGPGEDPYVASRMAVAKVRGFQGADLAASNAVAATAKHFCAYGAALAGRDYASVDISERTLREVYLPPFEAAVKAGAAAIMPAFNDIAGVPMTAHVALLRDWLRGELGFEGVVVSDYNAIAELMNHGIAGDIAEAAALALKAGVDIDMMANAYTNGLPVALERGLVSMEDIDRSVRRVLRLKERLGLFDDPYGRGVPVPPDARTGVEQRALARDVAHRAVVLLTNNGVLPVSGKVRRVALLGPLADARGDMRGPWYGAGYEKDPVTILEGLMAGLPGVEILHVPGVDIAGGDASGIPDALDAGRSADLVVLAVGEAANMSGEATSRAHPGLPGCQADLVEAVLGLGKPVVVLLSSGRPLMVSSIVERADAVLATWWLGTEAGHAIADVLTGKHNPSGRLSVTWPREVGQVPIFYGERPSGRPANPADHYTSKYLDVPVEPLFPFGHGLSYGRFTLQNLRATPPALPRDGEILVEVDVVNEGTTDGEETVFLFIHDPVASVARPLMELKRFAKARPKPGATKTVRFSLPVAELAFPGLDLKPVVEPGVFEVLVGTSADRQKLLRATVKVFAD
ncbi:glycoside hydrolase family 3 N-terminal domain-containing protein [Rhodoligotrophos defluvii]|uniref:glycoside hydrolase family 3 N-terminal domain-containing protein n=1 Tax=Rhodoligotrophos defluvii TaxID=2561934 RepID=UPI0010C9D6AA|nr:glycoside hydrolase family 3 N-terminal domain-containing protein [Rhodoligotrophos defluvii]